MASASSTRRQGGAHKWESDECREPCTLLLHVLQLASSDLVSALERSLFIRWEVASSDFPLRCRIDTHPLVSGS